MENYYKVGPLGSCDKRCVLDYDEVYGLLNMANSKLAEAISKWPPPPTHLFTMKTLGNTATAQVYNLRFAVSGRMGEILLVSAEEINT